MTQSEEPSQTLRDDAEDNRTRNPGVFPDLAAKTPDEIIHLRFSCSEVENTLTITSEDDGGGVPDTEKEYFFTMDTASIPAYGSSWPGRASQSSVCSSVNAGNRGRKRGLRSWFRQGNIGVNILVLNEP